MQEIFPLFSPNFSLHCILMIPLPLLLIYPTSPYLSHFSTDAQSQYSINYELKYVRSLVVQTFTMQNIIIDFKFS
jgi:hypothetical protein